jgi:hypothetical protein
MASIKILVHHAEHIMIKERLKALCHALNDAQYDCTLYSSDLYFENECRFQHIKTFTPEANDLILSCGVPFQTVNDVFRINEVLYASELPLKKNKFKYKLKRWIKRQKLKLKKALEVQAPKNFRLFNLSFRSGERLALEPSVFDGSLSAKDLPFIDTYSPESFQKSPMPSQKKAVIVSPIEEASHIKETIEQAVKDGMESIYLAGTFKDPVYYAQELLPLLESYAGKIQVWGSPHRLETLMAQVTDVYDESVWAIESQRLADLWGRTFHGNEEAPKKTCTAEEAVLQLNERFNLSRYKRSGITVVLNGFRRGHNLDEQIAALKNQTFPPDAIMLWYNDPDGVGNVNQNAVDATQAAVSNVNWGVWSRFYYALNAKTKYVCVFDDDTIPGERWLENCLTTMQTHRGLLGSIGLIYHNEDNYYDHTRYGWANPNEETVQVDIVGHSWFFEREMLTAFCRELPLLDVKICGEDIHFSYTLQKYFGLNTYVPPHPKDDPSLWGSLKGWQLGVDQHAISHQHTVTNNTSFLFGVNDYFKACQANGWTLLNFKTSIPENATNKEVQLENV